MSVMRLLKATKLLAVMTAMAIIATACGGAPEGAAVVPEAASDDASPTTQAPTTQAPVEEAPQTTEGTVEEEPVERALVLSREFAGEEIEVTVVRNRRVDLVEQLTPAFTERTGIDVTFIDIVPGGSIYYPEGVPEFSLGRLPPAPTDVVMIGPFETPQFGQNGWLLDLTPFVEADPSYDLEDIIPSVRALNSAELPPPFRGAPSAGRELYGLPFHGESTFLMFNEQVMADAGIVVPDAPTWEQVRDIAAQVHSDQVAGICLNSTVGWDELGASLTTMVNTFGGTWWEPSEEDPRLPGEPQINQADSGFRAATEFYVDLVRSFGPSQAGDGVPVDCLEVMNAGGAAMWFGSTADAPALEDGGLAGNLGVAAAPVGPTGLFGGGLWNWSFAITPGNSPSFAYPEDYPVPAPRSAAFEFIKWATSKEFIELAGETNGWDQAPAGTRLSTYENPEYLAANESFATVALAQLLSADPDSSGTTNRPGLSGVQYVAIPEFSFVADDCSAEIVLAIDGWQSVDVALDNCQRFASDVSY